MPKNLIVKLMASIDCREMEIGKKILRPDE